MTAPPERARSVRALSSYFDAAAPEPLFVLSAIAQYTGATIAMLLFDEVAPRTVAWLRVASAAVVLILVSPGRCADGLGRSCSLLPCSASPRR